MEEKGPEVNNDEKGSQVNKSQNENENENNRSKVTNAGEQEQEIQQVNFYYLEKRDGEDASVFNGANDRNEDENILKPHAILNKYAICILLKEDSTEDSDLLKLTLDGIISNFGGLSELGINCQNILIYVFVNKNPNNKVQPTIVKQSKNWIENKHSFKLNFSSFSKLLFPVFSSFLLDFIVYRLSLSSITSIFSLTKLSFFSSILIFSTSSSKFFSSL